MTPGQEEPVTDETEDTLVAQAAGLAEAVWGDHAEKLRAERQEAIRFEKETRGDAMVAATVGLRVVRSPDAGENAANVALAAADAWDEKRASR